MGYGYSGIAVIRKQIITLSSRDKKRFSSLVPYLQLNVIEVTVKYNKIQNKKQSKAPAESSNLHTLSARNPVG